MHVPKIDPAPDHPRPLWSVMIPAYNQADLLAKTIRSVLDQDPGPEHMQIEVVDDHSMKQDLKLVVDQVGGGRVQYFRQPTNVGITGNFNTCLQRSRGYWIHLLHGDDLVMPGFYARLKSGTQESNIGAVFCRFIGMDEDDHWTWISALEARSAGVLPGYIERIAVRNHIQAPSIVVLRRAYEEIGGFDPRLFHCADWDMWKRIASNYAMWYEPTVLAGYRTHSQSDTSRLMRTGANIRDMRRSVECARAYLPGASVNTLTSQALLSCADFALSTAEGMLKRQDISGAVAQSREAVGASCSPRVLIRVVGMLMRFGGRCVQSPRRALAAAFRAVRPVGLNGAEPSSDSPLAS